MRKSDKRREAAEAGGISSPPPAAGASDGSGMDQKQRPGRISAAAAREAAERIGGRGRRKDGGAEMERQFIEIGVTALRDQLTGDFLPAVPLYIEKTSATEASAAGLVEDIYPLLKKQFDIYARESGLLDRKIAEKEKVLAAETISAAAEAAAGASDGSGQDQRPQKGRRPRKRPQSAENDTISSGEDQSGRAKR